MNKKEYLLTAVGEECSEVHQRCSKALRFGMSEVQPEQALTNEIRILREFNDLLATMEMLFECSVGELIDREQIREKKLKVEKFMNYSMECGTLK